MNHQSRDLSVAAPEQKLSVVATMATQYGMRADAFEATLRGTVVPKLTTREEFAAFVLVAKHYNLNPLLKEIYAIPKKGGGIQPVVGVDGWFSLANEHPQFDGIEFEDHLDAAGQIEAITCRIWRKDRSRPIAAKEWLVECRQGSEPWKQMPRRMLRHKAAIQTARIAFGFAGIMEPDEAERIQEPLRRDGFVRARDKVSYLPADESVDAETGEILSRPLSARATQATERVRDTAVDAELSSDADYLQETVQQQPKQTRRPRKTANEKLAEAEGRAYVPPVEDKTKGPAMPGPEELAKLDAYDAQQQQAAEQAEQLAAAGQPDYDDHEEDPQVTAFRTGWVGRSQLKARTAPPQYQGNRELITFYERGWDAMAKHYEHGNAPQTADESMQMLDVQLDRIFN